MKTRIQILTIILSMFMAVISGYGQEKKPKYSFNKGDIVVEFYKLQDSTDLDAQLRIIGSSLEMTDSLQRVKAGRSTPLGWELMFVNESIIQYRKPLKALSGGDRKDFLIVDEFGNGGDPPYDLDVPIGINSFKRPSIVQNNDQFTIRLFGFQDAQRVILSGTFNDWSTSSFRMTKKEGAWEYTLPLKPGKHLYKFIVDGNWITDPSNEQKEMDWSGNTNSVFFHQNYKFTLEGYPNAKSVYLAGSFNDWEPRELKMNKSGSGWELEAYLREGTHTYKFIVDGEWITDPTNPSTLTDLEGNVNSVISLGDPHIFVLRYHEEASQVYLSGDFIDWEPGVLPMEKENDAWVLPYVLRPGNYEYKFIVDGEWIPDPGNDHQTSLEGDINSVLCLEANHVFYLEGYQKAEQVLLSGTFNNWVEDGYSMRRTAKGWEIKVHLLPGKNRYKFIVDGEWIIDPENPLWEINQYGTKDSILWKE